MDRLNGKTVVSENDFRMITFVSKDEFGRLIDVDPMTQCVSKNRIAAVYR